MSIITVENLKKSYTTYKRGSGLVEATKSLFIREKVSIDAVNDISFQIEEGSICGILGPNGAGKSTLVKLICRMYKADSGEILVNGKNIYDYDYLSYMDTISAVFQDYRLFNFTIAENISYGKPDATREEIIEAAKAAKAHSFIKRLPKGYDTEITEDGGNLSQGQKQLLCIARVMLCLPPMLILDEATSSIDTNTELLVQEGIKQLLKNRTSFIVAHRISTIKGCDRIMYINDGQIAESGNHEELMEKKDHYFQLYTSQLTNE